jgi:hypothetical protein
MMDISTSAGAAAVVAAAADAAAVAIGHGRGLLAVVNGRRHGRWWRVHVHQHHGATLAAAALALRQKDLRVQFLQLRLCTHNLIAVNDRKTLLLYYYDDYFLSLSFFFSVGKSFKLSSSERGSRSLAHKRTA